MLLWEGFFVNAFRGSSVLNKLALEGRVRVVGLSLPKTRSLLISLLKSRLPFLKVFSLMFESISLRLAFIMGLFLCSSYLKLFSLLSSLLLQLLLKAFIILFTSPILVTSAFVIFTVSFVPFFWLFIKLFHQAKLVFVIVLLVSFSFFIIAFWAMHLCYLFLWLSLILTLWTFEERLGPLGLVVVLTYWLDVKRYFLDKFEK